MSAIAKTESFAAVITVIHSESFGSCADAWDRDDTQSDIDFEIGDDALTHLFTVDDAGAVIADPFTRPLSSVSGAPIIAVVFRGRLGIEVECFHDSDSAMERFDEDEYRSNAIPKPTESSDCLGVYDLKSDGMAKRWSDREFDSEYADYRGEIRQAYRDQADLIRDYHASVL